MPVEKPRRGKYIDNNELDQINNINRCSYLIARKNKGVPHSNVIEVKRLRSGKEYGGNQTFKRHSSTK